MTDNNSTDRIKTLTDGIFAVAMTLLVLDIHVPAKEIINNEHDALYALGSLTPKLLSYLLSFLTLGIMWIAHSKQFNYIDKSDVILTWISILFLLFVCLLPFSTAFLSEHFNYKTSHALYELNLLGLGISLYAHWKYAYRRNYLFIESEQKKTIYKEMRNRIIRAQILYALAGLLCLINNYLSIVTIITLQATFAFSRVGLNSRKKIDVFV